MSASPPSAGPPRTGPHHAAPARLRDGLAAGALGGGVLALVVFGLGAWAVRAGWLDWGFGVRWLLGRLAPGLAALALLLGLAALVAAALVRPRRGLGAALAAVALAALTLMVWFAERDRAARLDLAHAPVHDVATDWRDPLMPTPRLEALRGRSALPVEAAPAVPEGPRAGFLGRLVAEVNARTCPGAAPVVLPVTPDVAYFRTKAVVAHGGMTVVTDDPAAGVLEATVARGWLGARYDLMARVRREGAGARIDLRSISRHGQLDHGINCERVSAFRAQLARSH